MFTLLAFVFLRLFSADLCSLKREQSLKSKPEAKPKLLSFFPKEHQLLKSYNTH